MTETSILGDGSTYVLVAVRDGYQIWDKGDYFSTKPRGCPCGYFGLTEDGEDAAWRSFNEREPVGQTEDESDWERGGDIEDEIGQTVFCSLCGVELSGEGRFCSSCGTSVVDLSEFPHTAVG